MQKNRLTTQVSGNIIFGYPPELPPIPEIILNGKIYEKNMPFTKIRQNVKNTWKNVKRSFARTGVRASSKV